MKLPDWLIILVISTGLVLASFVIQGNIGLNLSDEGKLWYGTERTAAGEIPMRDYRSYEPGRYYWTAGWSFLFGTGIMGVRCGLAIVQVIGLMCGLVTLRRLIRSWWMVCAAGLLLLLWMFPGHKVFEHTIALAAVYLACLVIETPCSRNHFLLGVYVGLAAFFGRNHGVYTGFAFLGLLLFVWQKQARPPGLLRRLCLWGSGIVLGYMPVIVMSLAVHDFFKFFMYVVRLNVKYVNFPLPIPWPWTFAVSTLTNIRSLIAVGSGVLFLVIPIFYGIAGVYSLILKSDALRPNAPLIASIWVGLPYLHHAFARADIPHLAQAIHPFLIGLLCVPYLPIHRRHRGWSRSFVLIMSVLLGVLSLQQSLGYQKYIRRTPAFVPTDIKGERLWVEPSTSHLIRSITATVQEYNIAPDEPVFIASLWPGLYSILQKRSPAWEIYFSFPATVEMQQYMIAQLNHRHVTWAIVSDTSVDGREDLRFVHTHPLLWEFLVHYFEPVPAPQLPAGMRMFKRRIPGGDDLL